MCTTHSDIMYQVEFACTYMCLCNVLHGTVPDRHRNLLGILHWYSLPSSSSPAQSSMPQFTILYVLYWFYMHIDIYCTCIYTYTCILWMSSRYLKSLSLWNACEVKWGRGRREMKYCNVYIKQNTHNLQRDCNKIFITCNVYINCTAVTFLDTSSSKPYTEEETQLPTLPSLRHYLVLYMYMCMCTCILHCVLTSRASRASTLQSSSVTPRHAIR